MALRRAALPLAAALSAIYRAPIEAEDSAITASGNLAFSMAMRLIADSSAAVMLPTPWYFNPCMALSALGIPAFPW